MKRALVTGNAGFIGSYFEARLRSEGYDVLGIDIAYGRDCRPFFAKDCPVKYDIVIHAAANVGGRLAIEHQPLWVAQDLGIDAAMFEWAARTEQPQVLYFSSSAAYPIDLQWRETHRPLKETDIALECPAQPDTTYGWTKTMGEILADYARDTGVEVTIVRPFSGYGAHQSADYPFRAYIDRALARVDPFPIWGDGTATRDFIHIRDIYSGCMTMLEGMQEGPYNLGTGRPTSFTELADIVCGAAGYSPSFEYHLDKPEGVHTRVANTEKLNREVFTPRVSLENGVKGALDILTS